MPERNTEQKHFFLTKEERANKSSYRCSWAPRDMWQKTTRGNTMETQEIAKQEKLKKKHDTKDALNISYPNTKKPYDDWNMENNDLYLVLPVKRKMSNFSHIIPFCQRWL